jgi:hypothetical protein
MSKPSGIWWPTPWFEVNVWYGGLSSIMRMADGPGKVSLKPRERYLNGP